MTEEHIELLKFIENNVYTKRIYKGEEEIYYNYHFCNLYPRRKKNVLRGVFVYSPVLEMLSRHFISSNLFAAPHFYIYAKKDILEDGYALRNIYTPANKIATLHGNHIRHVIEVEPGIQRYMQLPGRIYTRTLALEFITDFPHIDLLFKGEKQDADNKCMQS